MARSASGPRLFSTRTLLRTPDPSHPTFAAAAATTRKPRRCRMRGAVLSVGGRGSGPGTPLLRWKFDDGDRPDEAKPEEGPKGRKKMRRSRRSPVLSARRLVAGIWHLQLGEVGNGGGERRWERVGTEIIPNHLRHSYDVPIPSASGLHTNGRREFASPIPVHHAKNAICQNFEGPVALSNSAMEKATKWDSGCLKASDEVYRFYSHIKLLEDQQVTTVSVVSSLQAELEQAHARINELDAECQSAKKRLDHFLKRLADEKASWRSKEHEKVRAITDELKTDLNRERKSRQRMEIVNSKLVNELTEAKLSAKRFMQDYEKERKARELMEEVFNELAKELEEDKAEVETLKSESMKIREEVEEERKMLQMAEVWREERVQMKLVDAKLTLENKYLQLSMLQSDIEAFLRERVDSNLDTMAMKKAEALQASIGSVKVQNIKEFTYHPPPALEDVFSIFKELQPREATNDRGIEPCGEYSQGSHASKADMASPDTNQFLESCVRRYANFETDRNGDIDDESGWETVSHIEEQGSSNSPDGSDQSSHGICEESNASVSGTDWEDTGVHVRAESEISEICSITTRQPRKKLSSIVRRRRSSSPNNGKDPKKISTETSNGRLSNAVSSQASETRLSPKSSGQLSSRDSMNPHIARGLKGCIEWSLSFQKQSLKAKLLEARMDSQKIQLKHALEQKN